MIRPLNKRIIGKIVPEEEKTGALILTNKEPRKDIFTVISISDNHQGIKVGDKILVDRYASVEKEIQGDVVYIIECDKVLGIIEEYS